MVEQPYGMSTLHQAFNEVTANKPESSGYQNGVAHEVKPGPLPVPVQ